MIGLAQAGFDMGVFSQTLDEARQALPESLREIVLPSFETDAFSPSKAFELDHLNGFNDASDLDAIAQPSFLNHLSPPFDYEPSYAAPGVV